MAAVAADSAAERSAAVEVATQIKRLFDVLGQFDQMLLRHRSIGSFPEGDELQRRRFG